MAGTTSAPRTAKTPASKTVVDTAVSATEAAETAVGRNKTTMSMPLVGEVALPPVDHLVWYASVAVLTAVELLEWPVALVLAVGKLLADNRSHRTLRSFGEALEEAG